MATLFTILIAVIATLLVIVVLAQNPKGGGLNSAFGNSQAANQILGAANSTDILEKVTWGLAAGVLVLSLGMATLFKGSSTGIPTTTIETTETTTTTPPTTTPENK